MRTLVLLSALLAVVVAGGARAQGPGQSGVNPSQTNNVVTALAQMFDACREIALPYQPDCLNRAMQRGAGRITNNPGYWEAHVALNRAARSLAQFVREHADDEAARIRVAGYRLKAVGGVSEPAVRGVAEAILARVEQDFATLPDDERDAFAPIATVIRTERPWP